MDAKLYKIILQALSNLSETNGHLFTCDWTIFRCLGYSMLCFLVWSFSEASTLLGLWNWLISKDTAYLDIFKNLGQWFQVTSVRWGDNSVLDAFASKERKLNSRKGEILWNWENESKSARKREQFTVYPTVLLAYARGSSCPCATRVVTCWWGVSISFKFGVINADGKIHFWYPSFYGIRLTWKEKSIEWNL